MKFGDVEKINFEKELLTAKELAYILQRSYFTVSRWRSEGMPFTAGLITVNEAREWLRAKSAKKRKSSQVLAK